MKDHEGWRFHLVERPVVARKVGFESPRHPYWLDVDG